MHVHVYVCVYACAHAREAALTLARSKGQHGEAVLALIESNAGIIESPGTRLTHNPVSRHYIGVNQATVIGSDSSSKKSNLIATSNEWLQPDDAPEEFRTMALVVTDATTKGIRKIIKAHGRCIVSSDEAANTFEVDESDREAGLHFLSKAKLNTWTQSEYDGPSTGHGSDQLSRYGFALKCAGQTRVVEQVAKVVVHGFHKRLRLVFGPPHTPQEECQDCACSE